MALIRTEINILNEIISAASGSSKTSEAIVQLDTTQYSGTVTYYFEIVAYTSASITPSVSARRFGTSTDDVTITSAMTTTPTLFRSSSFTPPAATTTKYVVFIDTTAGATKNVKSARIIVLQNDSALSLNETQFEIGNAEAVTAGTQAALAKPKYWNFNTANWNQLYIYWSNVMTSNTTKVTATAQLQQADGTGDGFTGWASVGSDITTTSATPVWQLGSELYSNLVALITSGRNLRVTYKTSNTKSTINAYCAKIHVLSRNGTMGVFGAASNNFGVSAGDGQGCGFKLGGASTITAIKSYFLKTGTPSGDITVSIASSLNGADLATGTLAQASVTTSFALYTVNLNVSVAIPAASTYYIRYTTSGADPSNNYSCGTSDADDAATVLIIKTAGTWGTGGGGAWFELVGQSGIQKMEQGYLMANTGLAAGTALQTYLTKWDSAEWSGFTNAYYHVVDAANGSTSVIEADTAAGTQITGSVVTSPDNQGTSSALTMPANGNLDCKATTNGGDVYATRILVLVTPAAAASFPYAVLDQAAEMRPETVRNVILTY